MSLFWSSVRNTTLLRRTGNRQRQTGYGRSNKNQIWPGPPSTPSGMPNVGKKPEDSNFWLRVAPAIALSYDEADYTAFCKWIVQQPVETPDVAERVIWVCLLKESGIDISALPAEIMSNALDEDTRLPGRFPKRGWSTRTLLAYRSGDAEAAVKFLAKSEESQENQFTHAMNMAIGTLVRQELGNTDDARKLLGEASQLINQLQLDEKKRANPELRQAEILLREAEAKIKGQTVPKPAALTPDSASPVDGTASATKPDASPADNK
jgi:hypothetical protein